MMIWILSLVGVMAANQLTLTHPSTHYNLPVSIGAKSYSLVPSLQNEQNWLKMSGCVICDGDQCEEDCLDDGEGVKCSKHYCQVLEDVHNEDIIIEGEKVKLNLTTSNQQLTIIAILAKKMNKNTDQLGKLNLLSPSQFENVILLKDNSPNITMYYDEQPSITWLKTEELKAEEDDLNLLQLSSLSINSYNEEDKGAAVVSIPLTKTNAEISLEHQQLLLPSLVYKKLTVALVDKYFNLCSFGQKKIVCEKEVVISHLANITLAFMVNGVQIQMPLKMLFTSCKERECQVLLGRSRHKKTVIIGDFILNTLALEYKLAEKTVKFHRINNQWSTLFEENPLLRTEQIGFFTAFITIIFRTLFWVLKVIFYLAMLSLLLNCAYHWRDIIDWFIQIKTKIEQRKKGRKKHQGKPLEQESTPHIEERISSDEEDA